MTKLLFASILFAACVPMGAHRHHDEPAQPQPRRAYVVVQQQTCTFSSDCGEGQSCRADSAGTNVCMGGGVAGDACWFSSDCLSNSCTDKVCR